MEGSQGPDCRVTRWGDGFLLQVSLSLGPRFFPYGFPVFFLVSHPSFTSSGPPTFVLSFFKTYPAMSSGAQAGASLPRSTTSLQTHILPTPPNYLPNIPRKSVPCTRLDTLLLLLPHATTAGARLCSQGAASKGSQGQEAVCHPRGTGAPGDTCPQGVALLGLLKDSEGTRPQQHLRGGMGQQGRRWDGTGNAVTSSWPHWVLHLHLRGKME